MAQSEAVGRITVGEFTETFRMDLSFWSTNDYRRSWRNALQALEDNRTATSCLISSITDPETTNFVFCWPLYRSEEDVYVQNSVLFLDELDVRFEPEAPWHFVGPRCAIDEDGNRISEWSTGMAELRLFLESSREE